MKVGEDSHARYARRSPFVALVMGCGLLVAILLSGCEKEPGKGGLCTIQGKVYGYDINQLGVIHDSGYAGGYKVYLSYGDNEWTDASETTSPEGGYAFQGLQKGNYRLFVYSECDSCLFNQEVFEQEVELTKSRQVAVLPDFVIFK